LTVTTAADSGAGSLRAEIAAANSGDTINFASSLKGQTITLTSGELLINKGLTIQGPGAGQLTISGGNHWRVFDVATSQPVVLTGLTISNGANTHGGGIYDVSGSSLTVSGCSISNCQTGRGGSGGGIDNNGTLTLSLCTLSGDSAAAWGGGIDNAGTLIATNCTLSGDVAGGGGGIFDTGMLTVTGCTLSGDSASFLGGGGVYVQSGRATLTNCTIARNTASGTAIYPGMGGGLYLAGGTTTYLTNCTISLNHSNGLGGGIACPETMTDPNPQPNPNVFVVNTIVAGNTDGSTAFSEQFSGADIYGSATVNRSLIGNGAGWNPILAHNGNIVGSPSHVINAMLGPLQNNGGPTMTMALSAGSPAIGTADNAFVPVTDQRGVTRRDLPGELTDIGAYEV
jgi:hypothetical protein